MYIIINFLPFFVTVFFVTKQHESHLKTTNITKLLIFSHSLFVIFYFFYGSSNSVEIHRNSIINIIKPSPNHFFSLFSLLPNSHETHPNPIIITKPLPNHFFSHLFFFFSLSSLLPNNLETRTFSFCTQSLIYFILFEKIFFYEKLS